MSDYEVGDLKLGLIHAEANEKKLFCFFTGFLEGIAASGFVEIDEVEPLVRQCSEFLDQTGDFDAYDLLQDFEADLLEHETVIQVASTRVSDIDLGCERSAKNRFMGFCAGIACDDKITLQEAKRVVEFSREFPSILADVAVRAILLECNDALLDGEIDLDESAAICTAITRLVGDCYADTGLSALGNVAVFDAGELPEDLDEQTFVLTGKFSISPRREIEARLCDLGGQILKTVSKKAKYIVVASEASRDWVETHKGHKIIKAQALREKTGFPVFIEERHLLDRLGF